MIELNNEMTHAELVAYFAAARQRINDLLVKVKAREKAKKKTRKTEKSAEK